ncbi:MAG TPA: DNA mismatch repair protein MutT [Syntrophobacteraceae bacterium]|nr:DNA mismatch repair protein MutT [Syntrophobacteraceae bacterium]HBD07986.1 DNA mismatch repair protein MutT [Syntrophobacteraceae bacterium]HBZ55677.1 DNA mismatch repair protein MutT [Syntrophobacteraceae bacterium]
MKRPAVGVGVVVINEGRILLGRRKSSHGSGSWSCPGGHLEFSETIEDCAKREVYEETSILIGNIRYGPFTNDVFVSEGKHYVTLFVFADYAAGMVQVREPEKDECWSWHSWDNLPQPLFLPLQNLVRLGVDLMTLVERSIPANLSRPPT